MTQYPFIIHLRDAGCGDRVAGLHSKTQALQHARHLANRPCASWHSTEVLKGCFRIHTDALDFIEVLSRHTTTLYYDRSDSGEPQQALVARVQVDDGVAHDVDVTDLMPLFLSEGEDAVKQQISDEHTYCFYVRIEDEET